MANLTLVKNGAKTANPRKRRKRRNAATTTASKTANPKRRKRRNATTASASVRTRNPVAAKSTANPKRRKRRRNGVVVAKAANGRKRGTSRRRRNGIFGDSKAEVKTVAALTGGLAGTKLAGGIVSPYAGTLLSYVGLQNFATPISDGVMALTVVPYVAGMIGGQDAKKFARLGGLAMVALDLLEMILPANYLPFSFSNVNQNPIVLGANGLLNPTTKALVSAATQDVVAAGQKAMEVAAKAVDNKLSGVENLYNGGGLTYYEDRPIF